ncbi:hypothetical protein ABZ260_15055 [Streptosporangium sp. NPDC006013]
MRRPVLITVVLFAAVLGIPQVRRVVRTALVRATGTALHTESGR